MRIKLSIAVMAFLVLFSLGISAQAAEEGSCRDMLPAPYKGEGWFVEGPACTGAVVGGVGGLVIGFLPAMAAGVVGWGVDLGVLVSGEKPERSYSMEYGKAVHGAIIKGIMYPVIYVVGAPFYILKKVFYDFPKYLISGSSAEPAPAAQESSEEHKPEQVRELSRDETARMITTDLC